MAACEPHPGGFRHEALLWDGIDQYLAATVPFVRDGIAAGQPVMAAVHADRWAPLAKALDDDAARVDHVDLARLGHSPARVMAVWRRFADEAGEAPCRGLGEAVWPDQDPARRAEGHVHEATLNVAIAAGTPLWLLCPYDVGGLDDAALREARRSHPCLTRPGSTHERSAEYAGPDHATTLAAERLPRPGPLEGTVAEFRRYRCGDLARIRRFVLDRARAAGLPDDRADDLCVAVNELAANSIDHGGGDGMLRMWREPDRLVVEVSDAGTITDPLAGRVDPTLDQPRGRGLWMAHQLADLLQVRRTARGTVLRAVTWLDDYACDPAEERATTPSQSPPA